MAAPRLIAALLAVLLIAGGCNASEPAPASTTTTTTSTTLAVAIRTTAPSPVTVAEGVDVGVADALTATIEDLRTVAESLRGLGFLGAPLIVLESPQGFAGRWAAALDAELEAPALAVDTRLLQLLGLLAPGENLQAIVMRNVPEPRVAFYDGATQELVVSADEAELDAAQRAELVRQLVLMLTDQYHDHTARVAALRSEGDADAATALAALAVADALYAELRYINTLSGEEQQAIAAAGVAVAGGPRFVVDELAFAGDAGLGFVAALLEAGGSAELDRAYGAHLTTESILHPMRFMAGEGVLELATPEASLQGYTVHHAGSRGELGLRSLLGPPLTPGLLTQTADGWGADHEIVLSNVDDVALGYVFRGDSGDDTFEVAQAFLDHATVVMGMNEGQAAGGGVEFVGLASDEGGSSDAPARSGPYMFVDRTGDVLVVVIASDVAAGRELRAQLGR